MEVSALRRAALMCVYEEEILDCQVPTKQFTQKTDRLERLQLIDRKTVCNTYFGLKEIGYEREWASMRLHYFWLSWNIFVTQISDNWWLIIVYSLLMKASSKHYSQMIVFSMIEINSRSIRVSFSIVLVFWIIASLCIKCGNTIISLRKNFIFVFVLIISTDLFQYFKKYYPSLNLVGGPLSLCDRYSHRHTNWELAWYCNQFQ